MLTLAITYALDLFRPFPLENFKDNKSGHVLWEEVWQIPPYKDTFNNGPWHRGNQHYALGLFSPLSSSVGSQRCSAVQGNAIWEDLSKENWGLWLLTSPSWSSLIVNIYKERKPSLFHILLGWSHMWFYMLVELGNINIITVMLESISLLPALAEYT